MQLESLSKLLCEGSIQSLCTGCKRSGYLAPGGKGEGAIEPVAVARLVEDAPGAAHDDVLKAAPASAAPVRELCQWSHLHGESWHEPTPSMKPQCARSKSRCMPKEFSLTLSK